MSPDLARGAQGGGAGVAVVASSERVEGGTATVRKPTYRSPKAQGKECPQREASASLPAASERDWSEMTSSWPLPNDGRNDAEAGTWRRGPGLGRALAVAVGTAAAALGAGCYTPPSGGSLQEGHPAAPPPSAMTDTTLRPEDLPPGVTSLRFGVPPFVSPADVKTQYEPVMRTLAELLGVSVELRVGESYDDTINGLVSGSLELALLPPASYVLARKRQPDLQLLAAQLANGATSYSSYILVRKDDPAESLRDLRGRRITFVDRRSTSGYILPLAALLQRGLDPTRDFAEVRFAGSHFAAVKDLLRGDTDAAATASGMLAAARTAARGRDAGMDFGDVRILAKAGRIPYDAVCAAATMPHTGAERVRQALSSLNSATAIGRRALAAANRVSGYAPTTDATYDGVRKVLARIKSARMRPQGDTAEPGAPPHPVKPARTRPKARP